jgi:hypothetical protein
MEQQPLIAEVLPAERPNATNGGPNAGNGRPRGARNLKHKALERVAQSEAVPILRQLCKQALDGDTQAAKIIFDRIWPRPRTAPIAVNLPETRTPAELRAAMHGILAQVASGQLASDDGAALVSIMRDVLDSHRVQAIGDDSHGAAEETSTRELLVSRLERAIAERQRAAALPAAEPSPE